MCKKICAFKLYCACSKINKLPPSLFLIFPFFKKIFPLFYDEEISSKTSSTKYHFNLMVLEKVA